MSTNEKHSEFSRNKITQLRECLDNIGLSDEIVVACGSYGRKDATSQSDIDYYIITDKNNEELKNSISSELLSIVEREPSPDGAFGGSHKPDELLDGIVGKNDNSDNMTRRVLLLQEGDWLFNRSGFHRIRRDILERYVSDHVQREHITRFLLNDIIRYYRTISVEYEFKVHQNKPWAIRNLKITFSRKLLYASGVFPVAETYGKERGAKITTLEELFNLPVIERMQNICGTEKFQLILNHYYEFLDFIADKDNRAALDALSINDREEKIFRDMKDIGHEFSKMLMKLFHSQYPDKDHPIHEAIMF